MRSRHYSIRSSYEANEFTCHVFIAITLLVVMVVLSVENQPHAFRDCLSCHVSADPSGAAARRMTGPITPLCGECHRKTLSEGYLHPVDIRPERVIVPGMTCRSRSLRPENYRAQPVTTSTPIM